MASKSLPHPASTSNVSSPPSSIRSPLGIRPVYPVTIRSNTGCNNQLIRHASPFKSLLRGFLNANRLTKEPRSQRQWGGCILTKEPRSQRQWVGCILIKILATTTLEDAMLNGTANWDLTLTTVRSWQGAMSLSLKIV